jgi:hypothetical protein
MNTQKDFANANGMKFEIVSRNRLFSLYSLPLACVKPFMFIHFIYFSYSYISCTFHIYTYHVHFILNYFSYILHLYISYAFHILKFHVHFMYWHFMSVQTCLMYMKCQNMKKCMLTSALTFHVRVFIFWHFMYMSVHFEKCILTSADFIFWNACWLLLTSYFDISCTCLYISYIFLPWSKNVAPARVNETCFSQTEFIHNVFNYTLDIHFVPHIDIHTHTHTHTHM